MLAWRQVAACVDGFYKLARQHPAPCGCQHKRPPRLRGPRPCFHGTARASRMRAWYWPQCFGLCARPTLTLYLPRRAGLPGRRCLLPGLWRPCLLDCNPNPAAQATPTSETAMFYFQTNALGFTPEFLGRVRLAGALASLAGVGVYNAALKDVPLRRMFLWTSVLGAGLGLTQILLITGARLWARARTGPAFHGRAPWARAHADAAYHGRAPPRAAGPGRPCPRAGAPCMHACAGPGVDTAQPGSRGRRPRRPGLCRAALVACEGCACALPRRSRLRPHACSCLCCRPACAGSAERCRARAATCASVMRGP